MCTPGVMNWFQSMGASATNAPGQMLPSAPMGPAGPAAPALDPTRPGIPMPGAAQPGSAAAATAPRPGGGGVPRPGGGGAPRPQAPRPQGPGAPPGPSGVNIPSLADLVGAGNLYGGAPSSMINPATMGTDAALNAAGYGLPSTQQGSLQGNYGPYRGGQAATVLQPGLTNVAPGYAGRPIPQSGYERVLARAPGPLRAGLSMPDRMVGPDQSVSTLGSITGGDPSLAYPPKQNWQGDTNSINLADLVAQGWRAPS